MSESKGDLTEEDIMGELVKHLHLSSVAGTDARLRTLVQVVNSDRFKVLVECHRRRLRRKLEALPRKDSTEATLTNLRDILHKDRLHEYLQEKGGLLDHLLKLPLLVDIDAKIVEVLDDDSTPLAKKAEAIWLRLKSLHGLGAQKERAARFEEYLAQWKLDRRKQGWDRQITARYARHLQTDFDAASEAHDASLRKTVKALEEHLQELQPHVFEACPHEDSLRHFKRAMATINSYLEGALSQDKLHEFIDEAQLERCHTPFSECAQTWAQTMIVSLMSWEVPTFNETTALATLERAWAFVAAVATGGAAAAARHKDMVHSVIRNVFSQSTPEPPTLLAGNSQEGAHDVHLEVWCDLPDSYSPDDAVDDSENKMAEVFKQGFDEIFGTKAIVTAHVEDIPPEPAGSGSGSGSGSGAGKKGAAAGGASAPQAAKYHVKVVNDHIFNVDCLTSCLSQMMRLKARCVLVGDFGVAARKKVMNPQFNRIYSKEKMKGFMTTRKWSTPIVYGGYTYFYPAGWRRYSLHVAPSAKEFDARYGKWPVAYHGTSCELAAALLNNGIIATRQGGTGDNYIYFSPSIEYSGHKRYAKVYMVKGKFVQVVLQVRLDPAVIQRKIGSTLEGTLHPRVSGYDADLDVHTADENFPGNEGLEWLVKLPEPGNFSKYCVIYGIMVRVFDSHPKDLPQFRWWKR